MGEIFSRSTTSLDDATGGSRGSSTGSLGAANESCCHGPLGFGQTVFVQRKIGDGRHAFASPPLRLPACPNRDIQILDQGRAYGGVLRGSLGCSFCPIPMATWPGTHCEVGARPLLFIAVIGLRLAPGLAPLWAVRGLIRGYSGERTALLGGVVPAASKMPFFMAPQHFRVFERRTVRETGVEPARVSPLDPKSSASANSATLA